MRAVSYRRNPPVAPLNDYRTRAKTQPRESVSPPGEPGKKQNGKEGSPGHFAAAAAGKVTMRASLRAITAGITLLSTTGFRVTHVRPLFHRRAMTRSARARVSIRASMPGEGEGDYGPAQSLRQTRVALGDGTEMLVANTRYQSVSYTSQAVAETSSAGDGFSAEGSSVHAYQSPAVESGLKDLSAEGLGGVNCC